MELEPPGAEQAVLELLAATRAEPELRTAELGELELPDAERVVVAPVAEPVELRTSEQQELELLVAAQPEPERPAVELQRVEPQGQQALVRHEAAQRAVPLAEPDYQVYREQRHYD